MQIQVEADRAVRKAFDLPARGGKPGVKGEKPALSVVKPKVPAAPLPDQPNLAELPAAGEHDANPFAYIDGEKDPVKKEEMLAKLTPAQEEHYLRTGRG